jgi:AcrR family transcriptional regulator
MLRMTTARTGALPRSRRERLRESTLREIADAGRAQLREVGPQGLTLSAVARELGMTAPALYRYVDGVHGLLTLLVAEGYSSLAEAVESARDAVPADDPGGRFVAIADALRSWAKADTAQYGLLFGTPVHGYVAPEDGPTADGARRAAGALWQVLRDARSAGLLGEPLVRDVEPAALALLEHKGGGEGATDLPPATQAAGWAALSLLIGAVAIEVFGHMSECDECTAAATYRSKVTVALCLLGLPDPR